MLNTAIQSVDRQFKISQSMKEQAEQDHLDAEFLRNLNEIEDNEQNDGEGQVEATEQVGPAKKLDVTEDERVSARLLDLKNKQITAQSVQDSMVRGVDVLKSVAERAGQMTNYLQKLEIDVERLETVEAHSEKLKLAAAKLAQDHRNQTNQNNELKQTLDQVMLQNDNVRDELLSARLEIDRVKYENERLEDSKSSQKAMIVKLENDKLVLNERAELWERAHIDITSKHKDAVDQTVKQSSDIKKREKKIAHQQTKLLEADSMIEQQRIELAEIRTNFEQVSVSNIETKSKLKETLAQHNIEISETNAKLALQQKRIAELETQNHVLNRQVAISEDLIAGMDHQLRGGAENPPTQENEKADAMPITSCEKNIAGETKQCEISSTH